MLTLAICAAGAAATAAPPAFPELRSELTQTPLLELFTSEGCSSCPPADRWLGELKHSAGVWRDFVPLAFHVDYWDSLGWHDRFAAPEFSARQQSYARSGNLSQVYTPGVLLRGAEWRSWSQSGAIPAVRGPRVGLLRLQAAAGNVVTVHWRPLVRSPADPIAEVALLGFELHTPVRRGENSGRDLQHDFVVLAASRLRLKWSADHYQGTLTLPAARVAAPRYALAGWISAGADPTPIQAVGGWWPAAGHNSYSGSTSWNRE